MPTTSPPILIWTPGGGVSGVPISNPPVYSQSDVTQLIEGQAYIDVVFGSVQTTEDWVLVACEVENTTDFEPLNIWPGIITDRTTAGFRLQLNGMPDSSNYYLHWAVSGINITPSPASTYQLSGPVSGGLGELTYTVRLPPSTTVFGSVTVTPSDGGAGGVFSVDSVTLSTVHASATFTYTPAGAGAVTISTTNSSTLIDPAGIVLTVTLPTYTLTGPSGGLISVVSTDFTVTLIGSITGTVTVTPSDGLSVGSGSFAPTTVGLTTAAPSVTFTYTPASAGAKTISVTNNRGLTNPGNLTYTVTMPPLTQHLLNTLTAYWALDEAASGAGRTDALATSNLTEVNAPAGATGIINNGCQFVAASSQYLTHADNALFRVTSDFTFSCWAKLNSNTGTVELVVAKDEGSTSGGKRDYSVFHHPTAGYAFSVNDPGTIAVAVGTPSSTGVWTHVVAWWDSADSKLRLRINDTTTYVSSMTGALTQTAAKFYVGAYGNDAGGTTALTYFDGIIDEVGFWKRKLTADEITSLYGGGAGFPFSSFLA